MKTMKDEGTFNKATEDDTFEIDTTALPKEDQILFRMLLSHGVKIRVVKPELEEVEGKAEATAEEVLEKEFGDSRLSYWLLKDRIAVLMNEYAELQTKSLKERVRELEGEYDHATDILSDKMILLDAAKDGIEWRDARIRELEEENRKKLISFLNWYWRNIDGKPYDTSAEDVVNSYPH